MVIAILTDFGPGSIYVGQMKAVLAAGAPQVPIFDLCHDIAPGPPEAIIEEGAFLLERSLPYLPTPSVTIAVVDPGVGTDRGVLVVRLGERWALGPDNGLLARLAAAPAAERYRPDPAAFALPLCSRTFHGRDVFAPLGAAIAIGAAGDRLGPATPPGDVTQATHARPRDPGCGRVVLVDRFGNLVTDVAPRTPLEGLERVEVGGIAIERGAATFGLAVGDAPFFTVGGLGTIEVACRSRSAADALGAARGASVRVSYREEVGRRS